MACDFETSNTARDDSPFVEWVADRYDRCHPDDSFHNLVKRAFFSRQDRRLMEDWLEVGRTCRRS